VVTVLAALFLVRALGEPWNGGFDPFFPDTMSYLRVRDRGPFSTRFWFDERPPAYPLVLWLTGGSARVVVALQSVAYVVAWTWLGAVVWQRITSRPVAAATIGVLVLTAVQARWALWTTHMLTESLSISCAVAAVAAWWQLVVDPRRWRLVVAVSISATWMLLRDSNAVTFTVFAVPALVLSIVLLRRARSDLRRYAVIGLAVLVWVGAYSWIGQVATNRGETSFHNNVGLRWLPDPEMSEFVLEAPFWLDGLRDGLGRFLHEDYRAYDLFDVGDRIPRRTLGPFDPTGSTLMLSVALVASTGYALLAARRRRALGLFAGFLLVPAWIDLYLSYAGDAVEVSRHLVGPLSRLGVATVVVTGIGVDAAIASMRRSSDADDAPEQEWSEQGLAEQGWSAQDGSEATR
jgi:hypothetical protein